MNSTPSSLESQNLIGLNRVGRHRSFFELDTKKHVLKTSLQHEKGQESPLPPTEWFSPSLTLSSPPSSSLYLSSEIRYPKSVEKR